MPLPRICHGNSRCGIFNSIYIEVVEDTAAPHRVLFQDLLLGSRLRMGNGIGDRLCLPSNNNFICVAVQPESRIIHAHLC